MAIMKHVASPLMSKVRDRRVVPWHNDDLVLLFYNVTYFQNSTTIYLFFNQNFGYDTVFYRRVCRTTGEMRKMPV